ncbi:DUF6328 family protein [Antrihabitans cavernicola]|uniref:Sodium:proton antiporter n=1 Tax=Antrihabitans cavernicola TaxID=2495913 RepID=A0A5A7SDL7_9NOCA|nr:DUF6328 family protein [Spelaeibacter cavernicola]KAA0022301.1 hypothetical protein FOY51_15110 [Spelaeibacter cavernicola]
MNVDHPERDDAWNRDARDETETERLDRNWISLLQELRVVQTGVQLLTGFLLILPFQDRFADLSDVMQGVYLATVLFSMGATILLIAPVGMHRVLFRQHRLLELVSTAHRCALAGLVLLGLALTGVATLIFDVVAGGIAGALVGVATAALFVFAWLVFPKLVQRSQLERHPT